MSGIERPDFDRAVLRRFRLGQDTWQIAKVFERVHIGMRDRVTEATVANALARARENEKPPGGRATERLDGRRDLGYPI